METHTTNINDLPIDNEESNYELPEQQLKSSLRHVIDPEIKQYKNDEVRFNEHVEIRTIKENKIKDLDKMIIISTLLFIVFNEPFIKNYLLNILMVIFGNFIKQPNGITSKYGLVLYGLCYGLFLYVINLIIDIPSLEF
jgi:hypothetical protein